MPPLGNLVPATAKMLRRYWRGGVGDDASSDGTSTTGASSSDTATEMHNTELHHDSHHGEQLVPCQ